MLYHPVAMSFFFAFTVALFGCGRSQTTAGSTGAQAMKTQSASQETFAEVKFEPIEFKATKRPQPQSVDEATASLDAIKKLYNWNNIPAALNKDLTTESVYQYVKAWKLLKEQIPHDIEFLKDLDGASIPGADKFTAQPIDNLKKQQLDWLENRLPKQMADSAKYTRQFLTANVDKMKWNHIEKAADCDMSDSIQVTNLLSRPDQNELRAEQIKNVDLAYASLAIFDQQISNDSDSNADWQAQRKSFRSVVDRYQEKLQQAGDAILPPSDINDAGLEKIAAKVLSDKKYKLPKAHRIIVNAPKRSFGKDHFTVDFGERSIEKSPYRWEEFQVATIEQEGDHYFLWYNTLLHYSVGPHTVPTNKWVLGPRHRSAPISKKNIDK